MLRCGKRFSGGIGGSVLVTKSYVFILIWNSLSLVLAISAYRRNSYKFCHVPIRRKICLN